MNSETPLPEDAGLSSLARPGSIFARTARGAGWVIGWRMATRGLGILNTLILVRLLVPSAFGLVALGYSFLNGLDRLTDVGIEDAIIRDDRPDRELYDTGFTINFLRLVGIAAIAAGSAIPLAHFFRDSRLAAIYFVFAAMYALTAVTNIGVVEFRRYIAFDQEFKLKIIPRLISVILTIAVAFIWRTYWALVVGIVSATLLGVVLGYFMHPYRPRFTLKGWRRIAGFSGGMWAIGFIGLLREQASTVIIGRLFNPAAVGFYSVGTEVAALPSSEIVLPLCRASFSGFSEARQTAEDTTEIFLRLLALTALITFPVGLGISLAAVPVVKLGFGTEWLPAVPLVQVLALSGTLSVFGQVCGSFQRAHGWLRQMVKTNIATTFLVICLLLVLVPRMGLIGAGIAVAIGDGARHLGYLTLTLYRAKLSARRLLGRVGRTLLATAAMGAILWAAGFGWSPVPESGWDLGGLLLRTVGLGACVYTSVLLAAWFIAGRPAGAEADFLAAIQRVTRKWSR